MAGLTSTGATEAPSPRPRAAPRSPGPCRPSQARRATAARGRTRARAGDTAGARAFGETLAAAPAAYPPGALRVLIFHGYLLQGTGSNVYNAELGAAFVRAGHELHLVCQDREPWILPWVDA